MTLPLPGFHSADKQLNVLEPRFEREAFKAVAEIRRHLEVQVNKRFGVSLPSLKSPGNYRELFFRCD